MIQFQNILNHPSNEAYQGDTIFNSYLHIKTLRIYSQSDTPITNLNPKEITNEYRHRINPSDDHLSSAND